MPSPESGFVPIDEASSDKVRFDVDLPRYIDRSQIRANTPIIESWMGLGGISHLRIDTFEEGRITSSPTIVGYDSQGNAIAGKNGSAVDQETYKVESEKDANNYFRQRSLRVTLNVNQLMEDYRNESLRSHKPWSKELNKAISASVRNTGTRVLLLDQPRSNLIGALNTFFLPEYIFDQQTIQLAMYSLIVLIENFGAGRSETGRHSFIAAIQADRAALLQARTRLQKVVKSAEELK